MNDRVLISVDLDYFNYVDIEHMNHILSVVKSAGITNVRIHKDHLPDSYNAWPMHRAWKNYTIWNYDEHSDDGAVVGGIEEIGSWCTWIQRKGAKIVWISERDHAYRCSECGLDGEIMVGPGEFPIPDCDKISGAAFFISPGYCNDNNALFHLFDWCETFGIHINRRKAGSWTIKQIKEIQ